MGGGELIVRLKQVKGVRGDEALGFGKADLYANLVLGDLKMSSKVVNNGGGDTEWNEEFTFQIGSHVKLVLYEKLRIYIYDADYWGDSRRGTAWIDLKHLIEGGGDEIPHTEYPVKFHGEQKGVVIVGFTFKPANLLPVVQPQLTTVDGNDDESTMDQLIHKIQELKPFHRKPRKKVVPAAEGSEEREGPTEEEKARIKAEHDKEHKPWGPQVLCLAGNQMLDSFRIQISRTDILNGRERRKAVYGTSQPCGVYAIRLISTRW
ncbi:hypothetical protein R1sor_009452 [Riccia sorocarpa]|uniref:C2 domain-containing protein n=1 Tax=Riccia sorocarpa TaxID=122646 RepID=A0ABD3HX10_9MARC